MFLTPEEIKKCTAWLLNHASPAVKFLTHKHILKDNPHSGQMEALWQAVENSTDARFIFSRQNEDGSWFSGGPWGPRGYRQQTGRGYSLSRPKFVTTAWILPYLGEMGFTTDDVRIQKACQYMLQEIDYIDSAPDLGCCGLEAVPLRAFASVGMASDERLQSGWDRLTLCQRTDGGWLNPNHLLDSPTPSKTVGRWPWNRSCAWGSFFAVQALFYAKNPEYNRSLSSALEFMVWHLSQKDNEYIRTWIYHGHNTVKELLMLSESGLHMNTQSTQALLNWLKGYFHPAEGMFRTQERPIPDFIRHVSAVLQDFRDNYGDEYWETISKTSAGVLRYHLYHLIEDDWLTYYLTRIAMNLNPS